MMWVFGLCATLFVAGVGWWAATNRETIRRYRDHLEAARDEAERRDGK